MTEFVCPDARPKLPAISVAKVGTGMHQYCPWGFFEGGEPRILPICWGEFEGKRRHPWLLGSVSADFLLGGQISKHSPDLRDLKYQNSPKQGDSGQPPI